MFRFLTQIFPCCHQTVQQFHWSEIEHEIEHEIYQDTTSYLSLGSTRKSSFSLTYPY